MSCLHLLSNNTVTAVALTHWLVGCGVIPTALLMVFIIFASVDSPTGELQSHTVSFSGLNFPDSSLGRWNRQSNLGLRCLMKFSIVFTGQRLELITSNIFPSDSTSVESLSPPWWFLVAWTELIVPSSSGSSLPNQHLFGKFSLIFSSSFSKVKGQVETSRFQ